MKNKKIKYLTLLGSLGLATGVGAQVYLCQQCSPGTYAKSGATSCTPCEAGTYQNVSGQTFCNPCEPGFASQSKASSCYPCHAGWYGNTWRATGCQPCSKGEYSESGKASTSCTKCPGGKYSYYSASSGCQTCPIGSYSKAGSSKCTPCPAGKVCLEGTETPIDISQCSKELVAELSNSKEYYSYLEPGIYQLELAGAGGGGAGGSSWNNCGFLKQQECWHCGGKGGNGELVYSDPIYIKDRNTWRHLKFSVGTGGSGGEGDGKSGHQGYSGGDSTASIGYTVSYDPTYFRIEKDIVAKGGAGASDHQYGGPDAAATGNGQGGAGGDGDCSKHNGDKGSNGWVKLYRLYDCKR